ncbi:MAG: ABC transporter permease subunit [Treponema sp.]|nr:ABC transporter permease subunit [Treponema sp.]
MAISSKINKSRLSLTLMALPFVVFVFAFSYVPLHGWIYAFYDYIPGVPLFKNEFIGFDNFAYILKDIANIRRVLLNTFAFYFLGLAASVIPVILAIMLTECGSSGFKKLVQTTTTLPNFISWVIVFSLAYNMFYSEGVLNRILLGLGIIREPILLLASGDAVYLFQALLGVWKGAGWGSIIYLAAIAGIDTELYEAAAIDGAGRWGRIRHITLPGIAPTYIVLLLLQISNLLSVGLEQYLVFSNNMTQRKIEVLDFYVYRVGLANRDYSYSIGIGALKTIISVILLFSVNKLSKKVRGESII